MASSGDLVVTGSRIPRPNVSAQNSTMNREASGIAAERDEVTNDLPAPDWVLKDRSYALFLTRLQGAVRANDHNGVIKLIHFPLRVNSNGRSRSYADAASVRADFGRIFTPRVTQAILNQRFDHLFGRDQGLMIGDGEVWFDHICTNSSCSPAGPVRITAINP